MNNSDLLDRLITEEWRRLGVVMSIASLRRTTLTKASFDWFTDETNFCREFANIKFGGITHPDLMQTFGDKDNPETMVTVERRELNKRSPMNPNPAAGSVRTYIVIAGGRASAPIKNLTVALNKAEILHKKLASAITAEREAKMPNWGKF